MDGFSQNGLDRGRARTRGNESLMATAGVSFDSDDEGGFVNDLQQRSTAFSKSEKSFFTGQGLGQTGKMVDGTNQFLPAVKGSPANKSLSPSSGLTPGVFAPASNSYTNGGVGGLTPGVFASASGMTSGEILRAAGEGKVSPDKAELFEDPSKRKKGGPIPGITPTLSPTERRQAKLRLLGTANNA